MRSKAKSVKKEPAVTHMATQPPQAPKEALLPTINEDGSRRWLRPRLSPGRFLTRRRSVAYALIVVFTLIPYIKLNGKPLILLDILSREFTFFGKTFLPTDTLLLTLFVVGVFLTIFLLTALFGRLWCGWICPQTVYMEFLFRPIERFFEGAPGKKSRRSSGLRSLLKNITFLFCAMFLAHIFLAYFVSIDQLVAWIRGSPFKHPTAFLVMAAVTGLMLFDFGFFREQVCLVACPYGRLQSVMLDRHSLIVTYDQKRGEPRGKLRKAQHSSDNDDVHLDVQSRGDCIDCKMCVTTCPTGIDIRNGLQMECIGCAQCIDACDTVMEKIKKPVGLIRYSSQAALEGQTNRLLRPRVIIYPLILIAVIGAFVGVLASKKPADVTILRRLGAPFAVLSSGEIANELHLRIVNRTSTPVTYHVVSLGEPAARLTPKESTVVTVDPEEIATVDLEAVLPPGAFAHGAVDVTIRVTDEAGLVIDRSYKLLGPAGAPPGSRTP